MIVNCHFHCAFLIAMCALASLSANADEVAGQNLRFAPNGGDTYIAGKEITTRELIRGDLIAAGSTVRIEGEVTNDVIVAAARIEISAAVGDDVRLAGADIELRAPVQGHAAIAGNEVRVSTDAAIGDWLWVSGARLRLDGDVGGELRAAGGDVKLNGRVMGDVELAGGRLRLGDRAVVEGNLTWRSQEPIEISDKAVIRGQLSEASIPEAFEDGEDIGAVSRLVMALVLLLTAAVLRGTFPQHVNGWSATVRERPLLCLIVGLATVATTPLVVGLLLATVLGWLLAVVVGLIYLLVLVVAGVAGINALAAFGLFWLKRWGMDATSTVSAWISLAIVALLVVFVGPLYLLLLVLGLGGMTLRFYEHRAAT